MTAPVAERAARLHADGLACNESGRPDLGIRKLRAGLRLARTGGADAALTDVRGRLLVSLAWAEAERGRPELGFRLLDEAGPLLPADERPVLHAQRALLLERTGRTDLALREYDDAVARLSEQTHALDLVKALNNRSVLHLDAGRIGSARADLRRCRHIAARHGLDLIGAVARINLGCLDRLAGDLPSALAAFSAARADYARLAPGRLAPLAVERARALIAAGLFTEADRELAEAVEQATRQRLGYVRADALLTRAEAALLGDRPAAAAQWARQARAGFLGRDNARHAALASLLELRASGAAAGAGGAGGAGGGGGAAVVTSALALAARLARLGLPEDAQVAGLIAVRSLVAAGRVRQAERVADRYGAPRRADRLDTRLLWRLARAELAAAAGRPGEAARQLRTGMVALHRYRSALGCLDLQTGAAVHGRDLARAGLRSALASGSAGTVYRWSERVRAQALLLPPPLPPDDPAAAAALEELRQVRHALRAAELAGRPAAALRGRAEALQRTVRERSWAAPGRRPGAGGPDLAPFEAVRSALGDRALVVHLSDGDALTALVVAGRSAVLVRLGGYARAEEALLRLRADLDTSAGRAMPPRLATALAAATRADARALAAAVLDPLLPLVGDRDLVVVPTGALATVPWAALPGCAGRPVTVAPSASTWLAVSARLRADPPAPGAPTLLVAGPGNDRGDAEVAAIARIRPQATVLSGADATPAATLAALDRVAVAHLVAHGRHEPENALFSSLELTGGPLMGYDLQRLARTPPTVVLSSCDLGLADVRPGDETVGMASALLSAGAATVVASTARVADDVATTAMTGFHRALAAGAAPAAALAATVATGSPVGFVCLGAG